MTLTQEELCEWQACEQELHRSIRFGFFYNLLMLAPVWRLRGVWDDPVRSAACLAGSLAIIAVAGVLSIHLLGALVHNLTDGLISLSLYS